MFDFNTLLEFALGLSLSAAAGFRVFVPLLVLSAAAVFGHFDLPSNLDWTESPEALLVFAVACALEVGGYYIPWLDNILDTAATPAAIIVGTLVSGSSLSPAMDPVAQWTLAIVAGGGTAGLTKLLTNILRVTSTAVSGGLTNPILATVELAAALGLSLLALSVPLVALAIVVIVLLVSLQRLWLLFRKISQSSQESGDPTEVG